MIKRQIKRCNFWGTRVSVTPGVVAGLAAFVMLFAMTVPAGAASSGGAIAVANVPFDFYCGTTRFPAGEYNIQDGVAAPDVISIRSIGGEMRGFVAEVREDNPAKSGKRLELVFTRYPDGRNYLREVRNPSSWSSYFPKSRVERESMTKLIGGVKPVTAILSARSW